MVCTTIFNLTAAIYILFFKNVALGAATNITALESLRKSTVLKKPESAEPFEWKNEYPHERSKAAPKEEWLSLVKDDPILQAPSNILTAAAEIKNADTSGNNTYCNWTWDNCLRSTDIVACENSKMWGLSFDDGPTEVTPALLEYLKTSNLTTTFFVIGRQVIEYPQTLKRAYEAGHEIGIHTWSHFPLTTLSNEEIIGELKWTELVIQEVLGMTPRLMRPPRGDIDDRVRFIVKELGYTPVMWTVDTNDWEITTGGQTENGLISDIKNWVDEVATNTSEKGHSSLMHDLNAFTIQADMKAIPYIQTVAQPVPITTCAQLRNASSSVQISL